MASHAEFVRKTNHWEIEIELCDFLLQVIHWEQTLRIPPEAQLSAESSDLILRLCSGADSRLGMEGAAEIKQHLFFHSVPFDTLRRQTAPYIPKIRYQTDTSNFDAVSFSRWWLDADLNCKCKREREENSEFLHFLPSAPSFEPDSWTVNIAHGRCVTSFVFICPFVTTSVGFAVICWSCCRLIRRSCGAAVLAIRWTRWSTVAGPGSGMAQRAEPESTANTLTTPSSNSPSAASSTTAATPCLPLSLRSPAESEEGLPQTPMAPSTSEAAASSFRWQIAKTQILVPESLALAPAVLYDRAS